MKKIYRVYIMTLILSILGIFILLYFVISSFFTLMYGQKKDLDKIIKSFIINQEKYDKVINELKNINDIHIKNDGSYYDICIQNNCEKYIDINIDDYSIYKNSIELMEKFEITDIRKEDNNVIFNLNSMIGLGQKIIFLSDIEKYKSHGHSISIIENIKDNWYYIEVE